MLADLRHVKGPERVFVPVQVNGIETRPILSPQPGLEVKAEVEKGRYIGRPLGHEQRVTGLIHELVELSMSEMDHATTAMLQWFVNEQVEEEAQASEIVFRMKLASAEKGAVLLYLLDHELGKRGKKD